MERKIFKFNDGEMDIFADPSEIDYQISRLDIESIFAIKRLAMLPEKEDGTVDFDKIDPADFQIMMDSYHEADPKIREAFGVKPFDRTTGTGLLFEDIVNLYSSYVEWRNDLKKNSG